MILASASSSVKTGMLLFCSLTQTVMRALCETVPRKEPLGIQDLGTFFQELPEYGQWLTGSYSPNLPNCNYHRYSWFQDLANVEKVGDLQEDAHEHFEQGRFGMPSHKSSGNRNTHPPSLWYPWLRHPLARMDHGLDTVSLNLHSAKKHLLSQFYPL